MHVKKLLRSAYEKKGRLPDYVAVHLMYLDRFRTLPNLKSPKTLNEKIAWRKLYRRDLLFTLYADKVLVKTEIAKLIGEQHVIETLWIGDDPGAIPFETLVPPYVIKVNHSSDGNYFVRTKNVVDKPKIVELMREKLKFSHGHMFREWGYVNMPGKIIVERMIEMPSNDAVPEDYKFFVYRGRAHFIQVDFDRYTNHTRNLYGRDWNLIPAQLMYPTSAKVFSKPANLDQLIAIAEKIGAQFDFSRVDLYAPPQGIFFGEVTFYPGAGLEKFTPDE